MKRVVIFYGPSNQSHLINSIVKYGSSDDIILEGFCVNNWLFNRDGHLPFFFRTIRCLINIPYVDIILKRLFLTGLLKRISEDYDAVDITYFLGYYYEFLNYLIKKKKPYKITFWGSDFYRASKADLKKKKYYLEKSNIIQVETSQVKSDVLNVYPNLNKKIEVCNYGIELFSNIDNIRQNPRNTLKIDKKNKVAITCGYNGSEGQQHLKIIDQIDRLLPSLKDRIILLFPMTYGLSSPLYLESIINRLEQVKVEYKIFTERFTEDELAELRLVTDIVVNIQITDAFSSSLVEHLYSGNILLVGDWLPYSIFDENNIKYHKISISNIAECLTNILLSDKLDDCSCNIEHVRNMSSWSVVSDKLKKMYNTLFLSNFLNSNL